MQPPNHVIWCVEGTKCAFNMQDVRDILHKNSQK